MTAIQRATWRSLIFGVATICACASDRDASPQETQGDSFETETARHPSERHDRRACLASSLLLGADEVPARRTKAIGLSLLKADLEKRIVRYRLHVVNIRNVVAAHIHMGAKGVNGPVVAILFGPRPPGSGGTPALLAHDTLEAADLVGPLAGQPIDALVVAMQAGEAYVNVHTNDGVAPANSGAGDFPDGEIRGQIMSIGPECTTAPVRDAGVEDAGGETDAAVPLDASSGSDAGGAENDGGDAEPPESFAALYVDILGPTCGGCHSSDMHPSMLNLSSAPTAYMQLVNVPAAGGACASSGLKRVEPGNVPMSLLVQKVTLPDDQVCGSPMPRNAPPLSAEQVTRISRWITQGALNN